MRTHKITKEVVLSILIPALVLGTCFLLPAAYFSDCMSIIFWPIENLLANKKTQHDLTLLLFGGTTPNYAPIQILLYMLFWPIVIFVSVKIGGALHMHLAKR